MLAILFYSRFLQHSGVYPDYTKEPSDLASGRPHVKNVTLLLGDWWGSGIIHAKVWMSDRQHMYVGSANNDWKSLTQVYFFSFLLTEQKDYKASSETMRYLGTGLILNSSLLNDTFKSYVWTFSYILLACVSSMGTCWTSTCHQIMHWF